MRASFNEQDVAAFKAPLKYSFVAAMNDDGYPHMNFIGTLETSGDNHVVFARNFYGLTKVFLEKKGAGAFFSLGVNMQYYRGKMNFTRYETEGELYDYYEEKPSSRYNAYVTFDRVYVNETIGFEGPVSYDAEAAAVRAEQLKNELSNFSLDIEGNPLSGLTLDLVTRKPGGKFLSWQDRDGIPLILPVFDALPAGTGRMIFPITDDVSNIPEGAKVSFNCIQLTSMLGTQIRGIFSKRQNDSVGVIDIKYLYNPMLFRPEIYWPMKPYEAVNEF
jgi:hypothetical protein